MKTTRVIPVGLVLLAGLAGIAAADAVSDCSTSRVPAERRQACQAVVEGAFSSAEKAKAHRTLGEAALRAGAMADARSAFDAALALNPADAQSWSGRGQARLALGDRPGAIADFSEALKLAPAASTYNARGHARLVSGDPRSALEDFERAVKLDPKSASALNNRGLAHAKTGALDAAIADYTQAIALNPLYGLAYNNRGYAEEAKGRPDNAAADFRRALAIDPSLVGARDGLARLKAADAAITEETDRMIAEGAALAEKNCAWCHAVGMKGESPNAKAPPFRTLAARYPDLALREPLSRGIAAPHDEMPNFKLPDTAIDKIVAYINNLTRVAPH